MDLVPSAIKSFILQFGNLIYSNILVILFIMLLIALVFYGISKMLPVLQSSEKIEIPITEEVLYADGSVELFSPTLPSSRIFGLMQDLIIDCWVLFFFVQTAFGNFEGSCYPLFANDGSQNSHLIANLLFILNCIVAICDMVRYLFHIRYKTHINYISISDLSKKYILINTKDNKTLNKEYILVKTKYQFVPVFLIGERSSSESTNQSNHNNSKLPSYSVVNETENVNEIIYHFDNL